MSKQHSIIKLMADRETSLKDLATIIGRSSRATKNKLDGRTGWSLSEAVEIARYFDVSVNVFFENDKEAATV